MATMKALRFEKYGPPLRYGGRQVAIASLGSGRVEFSLVDFYHNLLSLTGVDTMKSPAVRSRRSWIACERL
jgi:NADPH:quinone reductase-like Zn-dependent oxidoreductase